MTKPDFSSMTRQELRAYILAHPKSDDAIEALIKRTNFDRPNHKFPQTEADLQEMEALLQQKLGSSGTV